MYKKFSSSMCDIVIFPYTENFKEKVKSEGRAFGTLASAIFRIEDGSEDIPKVRSSDFIPSH